MNRSVKMNIDYPDSYNKDCKLYYMPQGEWSKEDYYYLHRVLHRIVYYYDKHMDEIKSFRVSDMSRETKVLINCIVRYYGYHFLFDIIPGGEEIKNQRPLEKELVLDEHPLVEDNVYKEMHVVY